MEPINTIHIRSAEVSDAEELSDIMIKAYLGFTERFNGETLPPMESDYRREIIDYPVWVLVDENQIAGGMIMMFETDHTVIANIAIDPKYQGCGLGRKLMCFAEQMTKRRAQSEMRLTTHVLLQENIDLYNHLGWVEYQRDKTKVFFKKQLK